MMNAFSLLCLFGITLIQPALSVISSIPSPSSLLMASAALICLYSQMKNGTLVNIGKGHSRFSNGSFSRSSTNRRPKSKSWFLKNIWGRRTNCTKAIHQMAKQFSDSFTNINPCLLLPRKTFQVSFPAEFNDAGTGSADHLDPQNSCDVIYNNDVFEKDSSLEMVKNGDLKRSSPASPSASGEVGRKRRKYTKMHKGSVKRLVREGNIGDGPAEKQAVKISKDEQKKTRSGRIY